MVIIVTHETMLPSFLGQSITAILLLMRKLKIGEDSIFDCRGQSDRFQHRRTRVRTQSSSASNIYFLLFASYKRWKLRKRGCECEVQFRNLSDWSTCKGVMDALSLNYDTSNLAIFFLLWNAELSAWALFVLRYLKVVYIAIGFTFRVTLAGMYVCRCNPFHLNHN